MQPVTGTVTRTANALDQGTRTLLTEVDIPNQSHRLLPGMFVSVTLKLGPSGTHWRGPAPAGIFHPPRTPGGVVGGGKTMHLQPRGRRRGLGSPPYTQTAHHGDQ